MKEPGNQFEMGIMPVGVLQQIESLDPVRDHQRIVLLSARCDFPFDTTRALEFALFRTYAVPTISALLDRTGEFGARTQKRYDDTDIIVSELMEHGYDSDRGRRALRQMNQIHGRFAISNDDYLYVLSTFVFEPIRWNERFGWRRLIEKERLAMFHFWREVGRRMGIRDIPTTYEAFEQFNRDYERMHYRYADSNRRVAELTLNLFCSWFPRPLRGLVRRGMCAVMDEPLLAAVGFARPSGMFGRAVTAALVLRARILRLLPRRTTSLLRTSMKHPSYPQGYEIESLGPPAAN